MLGLRTVAHYLVNDDASAGNLLLAQGFQEPPGLVDPQHSGDGGNDELCELLVPKQLLHHHHAVLHCMIVIMVFLITVLGISIMTVVMMITTRKCAP